MNIANTMPGSTAAALHAPVWWRAFVSEAITEWLRAIRVPSFIVPVIALPLAFFALFGIAMARDPAETSRMLVSYGVFAALGPALFWFGISIAMDRETGLMALKQISPLPTSAYLAAKMLLCLVITTCVIIGINVLARVFGHASIRPGMALPLLALHLGSVLPPALLGAFVGYRFKASAAAAICNMLYMTLSMLGGLWVPLAMLPHWLQQTALAMPTYHLTQLASIVVSGPHEHGTSFHLGAIGLMTAVFGWLAWRAARYARN